MIFVVAKNNTTMTKRPPKNVTIVPPMADRMADRFSVEFPTVDPTRIAPIQRSVIRCNSDLAGRSNVGVDNRTVAPSVNIIDGAAELHDESAYRGRLRIGQTSAVGSIVSRNNPPLEAQAIILARFL
jgi:hypothetical protein